MSLDLVIYPCVFRTSRAAESLRTKGRRTHIARGRGCRYTARVGGV
jgi:hypothetical protein